MQKSTNSMNKLSIDDKVNIYCVSYMPNSNQNDEVSQAFKNQKKLELSGITRTQLVEIIHEKSEILVIEFFEKFLQTCEIMFGSHNLSDLLRATFGQSFCTYIDTFNDKEGVSWLFLKEPWKSGSLDDLIEDLYINTYSYQLEFTSSEKLLLFNIIKEGAQSVDVFKSKADKVIYRNSFYTFGQIISAIFGEHVHQYVIISDTELRLKKRYRTMSDDYFLLNLGRVKECYSGSSSSDKTSHKKDSSINLPDPHKNTTCSLTFVADEVDDVDTTREEKKVNFSDAETVQIIEFLFRNGTTSSTKFFKEVYRITKILLYGCTLTGLFKALFGEYYNEYI